MESKKAREFIERKALILSGYNDDEWSVLDKKKAEEAVEIAEKEMMEKAIEAHRNKCDALNDNKICNRPMFKIGVCDDECAYMQGFINQLNNK